MSQSHKSSLIEEAVKRGVVLFGVGPLVSMIWLPLNGRDVYGFWDGVWLSWPFVFVAFVTGYGIRRLFNAIS